MSTDLSSQFGDSTKPAVAPPLDEAFRPAALVDRAFQQAVGADGKGVPLAIGLERTDGTSSRFETRVFPEQDPRFALNLPYVERLVKFLLWQSGGHKVT